MERISCGQEVVEKIIIILNVARTDKGETNIALEGTDNGCHWTLLFFKRNSPVWYYGDSLGWPFPLNSLWLENIVMQAEKKCGSKFTASRVQCLPLHDPSNTSKHHCNRNCKLFYPLQTCSSICGVVTATMAALLATDEHLWPSNMVSVVPHNMKLIENPSSFSAFLRQVLIHWVITQKLDTSMLYCPDNELDTSSVSEQQSSCTDEPMHHYEGSAKDQGMQDVSDSDPVSVTVSKQQHSYRNSQDKKTPVLHTLVVTVIMSRYVTLI